MNKNSIIFVLLFMLVINTFQFSLGGFKLDDLKEMAYQKYNQTSEKLVKVVDDVKTIASEADLKGMAYQKYNQTSEALGNLVNDAKAMASNQRIRYQESQLQAKDDALNAKQNEIDKISFKLDKANRNIQVLRREIEENKALQDNMDIQNIELREQLEVEFFINESTKITENTNQFIKKNIVDNQCPLSIQNEPEIASKKSDGKENPSQDELKQGDSIQNSVSKTVVNTATGVGAGWVGVFGAKCVAGYSIPALISATGTVISGVGTVHGATTAVVAGFAATPVGWTAIAVGGITGLAVSWLKE